jgi:3-oxoacyl-[acyl-carrier-protein] synthase-1
MRCGISAIGMATSVGLEAGTACASVRAGLARPQPLAHFTVLDLAEQVATPLVGRTIRGLTDGFAGIGRWITMARAACADLAVQARLPEPSATGYWDRTAACAILAEPDERRYSSDTGSTAHPDPGFLNVVLDGAGWPIPPAHRLTIRQGHAGLAAAVRSARAMLMSGRLDRVIFIAADSYGDSESLEWLAAEDRLKLEDQPFGLIPGEGAASFVLETDAAAAQWGGTLLSLVAASGATASNNGFRTGQPMLGEALSDAIRQALADAGIEKFGGMLVADLNGEPWRSHELGVVAHRLSNRLPPEMRWQLPATSLGAKPARPVRRLRCVWHRPRCAAATPADETRWCSAVQSPAAQAA